MSNTGVVPFNPTNFPGAAFSAAKVQSGLTKGGIPSFPVGLMDGSVHTVPFLQDPSSVYDAARFMATAGRNLRNMTATRAVSGARLVDHRPVMRHAWTFRSYDHQVGNDGSLESSATVSTDYKMVLDLPAEIKTGKVCTGADIVRGPQRMTIVEEAERVGLGRPFPVVDAGDIIGHTLALDGSAIGGPLGRIFKGGTTTVNRTRYSETDTTAYDPVFPNLQGSFALDGSTHLHDHRYWAVVHGAYSYYGVESHTRVVLDRDGSVMESEGQGPLAKTRLIMHVPDDLRAEAEGAGLTVERRGGVVKTPVRIVDGAWQYASDGKPIMYTPAPFEVSATVVHNPWGGFDISSHNGFFGLWGKYIDGLVALEDGLVLSRTKWANEHSD